MDEIERPLDSVEKPLNNNDICSEFEYDEYKLERDDILQETSRSILLLKIKK